MGGYSTQVAGTTITASWANTYVRDQVVSQFASKAARDSAITGPVAGMLCYTADLGAYSTYSGAWAPLGSTLISRQTLSVDTATVTFSSIPGDYTHLRIVSMVRATTAAGSDQLNLRMNGDSAANYDWTTTLWNDNTAPATASAGSNGVAGTAIRVSPAITAATEVAGCFSQSIVEIPHYSDGSTNRMKGAMGQAVSRGFVMNLGYGEWIPASATAVTSLSLFASAGSLKAGSVLSLYGIS